jgi:hypothetical protein
MTMSKVVLDMKKMKNGFPLLKGLFYFFDIHKSNQSYNPAIHLFPSNSKNKSLAPTVSP